LNYLYYFIDMSIFLKIDKEWVKMPSNNNLVFVIRPGAGTFRNRKAYEKLESRYKVVYFAETGGQYDNYPDNWENNANVSSRGNHLGGIVELLKKYIEQTNLIPGVIITGSRGGQVTLGKIWESLWRGPTIIINAGCLTTNTAIPKEVIPLFITMGNDYFKTVNTIEKILSKVQFTKRLKCIHLKDHGHMPDLNTDYVSLLLDSVDFSLDQIKIESTNPNDIEVYCRI
jgi:hypothetical protein